MIVSFTYREPCDVILKKNIYQFFNIPQCTAVLWIEFTTVTKIELLHLIITPDFDVRRTLYSHSLLPMLREVRQEVGQDTSRVDGSFQSLKSSIESAQMVIPMILTSIIFYGKPVDEPQISSLYSPASAAPIVTLYFVALSSLNFVSAIASVGLYYYNKKKEHM